jgi:hypothetical protein
MRAHDLVIRSRGDLPALADLLEDEGDRDGAACIRWMHKHRRWPTHIFDLWGWNVPLSAMTTGRPSDIPSGWQLFPNHGLGLDCGNLRRRRATTSDGRRRTCSAGRFSLADRKTGLDFPGRANRWRRGGRRWGPRPRRTT